MEFIQRFIFYSSSTLSQKTTLAISYQVYCACPGCLWASSCKSPSEFNRSSSNVTLRWMWNYFLILAQCIRESMEHMMTWDGCRQYNPIFHNYPQTLCQNQLSFSHTSEFNNKWAIMDLWWPFWATEVFVGNFPEKSTVHELKCRKSYMQAKELSTTQYYLIRQSAYELLTLFAGFAWMNWQHFKLYQIVAFDKLFVIYLGLISKFCDLTTTYKSWL